MFFQLERSMVVVGAILVVANGISASPAWGRTKPATSLAGGNPLAHLSDGMKPKVKLVSAAYHDDMANERKAVEEKLDTLWARLKNPKASKFGYFLTEANLADFKKLQKAFEDKVKYRGKIEESTRLLTELEIYDEAVERQASRMSAKNREIAQLDKDVRSAFEAIGKATPGSDAEAKALQKIGALEAVAKYKDGADPAFKILLEFIQLKRVRNRKWYEKLNKEVWQKLVGKKDKRTQGKFEEAAKEYQAEYENKMGKAARGEPVYLESNEEVGLVTRNQPSKHVAGFGEMDLDRVKNTSRGQYRKKT